MNEHEKILDSIPSNELKKIALGSEAIINLKREHIDFIINNIDQLITLAPSDEINDLLETSVGKSQTKNILSLVKALIYLIVSKKLSKNDAIDAMVNGSLTRDESLPVVEKLAACIFDSSKKISRKIEKINLAKDTLPILRVFETSVDLRAKIVDGKISFTSPVILFHLDTFDMNQELWFQADIGTVEYMEKVISKAKKDIEIFDKNFTKEYNDKPD